MNNTEIQKIADKARLSLLEQSTGIKTRIHWGSSFSLMVARQITLSPAP